MDDEAAAAGERPSGGGDEEAMNLKYHFHWSCRRSGNNHIHARLPDDGWLECDLQPAAAWRLSHPSVASVVKEDG